MLLFKQNTSNGSSGIPTPAVDQWSAVDHWLRPYNISFMLKYPDAPPTHVLGETRLNSFSPNLRDVGLYF